MEGMFLALHLPGWVGSSSCVLAFKIGGAPFPAQRFAWTLDTQ